MMDLSVLVPPPVEPITIEAAFVELRLGMPGDKFSKHPDYNAVRAKMRAATQHCEDLTGRAFVQQTLRLAGASAGCGRCGVGAIELLRQPVRSIVAVGYIDTDNAEQEIDSDYYYVITGNAPQLRFVSGYALPGMYDRPDALRIDYVAGYPPGTPADDYDPEDPPQHLADNVPAPIGQACLLTLRLLFENLDPSDREATERARDALLWPYKVLRV